MTRLLIATGIYPPDHGGPARFVPALAHAACQRGWQTRVLTLADVDAIEVRDDPTGFRVLSIPRSWRRRKRVTAVARHIQVGLKDSDVMFANGLYEEAALGAAWARRPWVAKIVGDPIWERARNQGKTTQDIETFQSSRQDVPLRTQRWALSWALSRAWATITPSIQLAGFVEGWGLERSRVIPNGIPVRPQRSGEPTVDVVTVCRLVPWKGLDVLIRACAQARLSLLIVGDGPMRAELATLVASLGSEDLVTFTGAVGANEVAGILDQARVFALNSSYEGMSFALLEARERGLPSVVGDNSGNRAVVHDGLDGFVVESTSVDAVRDALGCLTSNPVMAEEMGSKARQDTVTRYSIDGVTKATLDVLEDAAHG